MRCARRGAADKNWRGIEGEDQEGERAGERTGGRGPEGQHEEKDGRPRRIGFKLSIKLSRPILAIL